MQRYSRRFVQLGILFLITIALALSAQATTYKKASLKGSYGFLTNLWTADSSTDQIAMVGILTFNGAGKVIGSYTTVSLEVVKTGTLGETYTVSSNGTGKITLTTGSTAVFAIVLNNPTAAGLAQGVQLLQTNDSNNEVVSGTAVLQSTTAQTYSVASINGNFSFQWNLWWASPSGYQGSQLGTCNFDGKGGFKSSSTSVLDGVTKTQTQTGTYTVNADGSGTITLPGAGIVFVLNSADAGQAHGAQFIDNINESGDYVVTGTALMQ
jgi:hypothetical protein